MTAEAVNVRAKLTIPDRFYEKSDLWGLRARVRLFGVPLIWIVLIPFLYRINPLLAVAVIVPLGIAISKTTILVHEAVHGTLFRRRRSTGSSDDSPDGGPSSTSPHSMRFIASTMATSATMTIRSS